MVIPVELGACPVAAKAQRAPYETFQRGVEVGIYARRGCALVKTPIRSGHEGIISQNQIS